jgi:hypothetical protein
MHILELDVVLIEAISQFNITVAFKAAVPLRKRGDILQW